MFVAQMADDLCRQRAVDERCSTGSIGSLTAMAKELSVTHVYVARHLLGLLPLLLHAR